MTARSSGRASTSPSRRLDIAVAGIAPENIHFLTYTRYLVECGHNVTVITNAATVDADVRVVDFGRHTRLIKLVPRGFRVLLRASRVWRALRSGRFDVVSVQQMTPDGVYATLLAPGPVVPTFWGSDILRLEIRPWFVQRLMPRAVRRATRIHATSEEIAARLIGMGADPARMETFNYGVDLGVFAVDGPEVREPGRIVCTRGLRPFYRTAEIVRALPLLLEQAPDARLVLVGDGQPGDLEALEDLADECGVSERVTFTGRLAPAEIASELQKAAVLVSIPPTDSFALSVQEAMACGAFPVVSDIPAMRQSLDETNAEHVSDVSPQALAATLARALERARQGTHIAINRRTVEAVGDRRTNLARFEALLQAAADDRRRAGGRSDV